MAKIKKVISVALCTAIIFSLCGCGNKAGSGNNGNLETISVFCNRSGSLQDEMVDYNNVTSFQEMEKLTRVKVEWILPPSSGFEEKFNLLIASGKYPDVIVADWKNRGVEKYLSDGVIVSLSDYEAEMPNLTAYTKAHPEFAKDYVTESGKILYAPFIREDLSLNIFYGPLMRQDWLDKLGLEVPKNADELYTVLKAFKERDPNGNGVADEIPMSGLGASTITYLLNMFDTTNGFYVVDGQVKYGLLENNFTEGMTYIRKLYAEGLIDPDYIFQDRAKMDGKMTNHKLGFMYSFQPTTIANTMAEKDPTFKLVGIPHFENASGIKKTFNSAYTLSVLPGSAAVVTTDCKNPAAAAKWLDAFYSEKGIEIMNFGKEGTTYNKVDGKYVFTDLIMNPPDGKTASTEFGRHIGSFNTYFPTVMKWDSYSESLSPYGKAAIETWSDGVDTSNILPSLNFTEEEKSTITNKMVQIETYVAEMVDKVILGREDITVLNKARTEIKNMGIDEVIKIYQAAYDRYSK